MPRQPRQYQLDAFQKVRDHWVAGRRRVLLVAPVGAGKTACGEMLATATLDHDWAQVVWLATTETLIDQPAGRFLDAGIAHAFIKAGRVADASQRVQFCTAQTLIKRGLTVALNRMGRKYSRCLVFIDECHHCKSATIMQILNMLQKLFDFIYIVGLTATCYRLDGRGMIDVFDALVEVITPQQLVDAGILLPPLYWSAPAKPPDSDADDAVVFSSPKIQGDIVATWQLRGRGLPTICRAVSIDHSKALTVRFKQAGIRAAHIDGSISTATKRRLLVALSVAGSAHPLAVTVLCAGSNIFDEGLDSRACYEMLLPRGDDAKAAWSLLRCHDVELSSRKCLELRQRVLRGVIPELRDFWPGADSGAPMEPPTYAPLAVLIDAAPTASIGAWMQRQGRVVRAWRGDDVGEVAARTWQGLGYSCAKDVAIVLSHGGNLERHGYLLWHHSGHPILGRLFELANDAAWSPRLKLSDGVAAMPALRSVTCPGCLCIDMAGTMVCRYCGTTMKLPDLPQEDVKVTLVEKAPERDVVAVSTPGTREAYLRARYREMVAANIERALRSQPPYKATWAAVRFKAKFGHWPDGGLDRMLRWEFGIRES